MGANNFNPKQALVFGKAVLKCFIGGLRIASSSKDIDIA